MITTDNSESVAVQPQHVVMLCIVGIVVAGGSLLLSAAESAIPVDGAIDWHVESPLRAVVQLLCLDYRFPTIHQGAVKNYILGLGAGLGILAIAVSILAQRSGTDEASASEEYGTSSAFSAQLHPAHGHRIPALTIAQLLVVLYVLWSFASSRWSAAPDIAIGGSILLAIQFLWTIGLGNGLNRAAALIATRIIVIVAGVTAGVALWYYYGRNPTLRAKFPFGNPSFLATCLIPGILLGIAFVCRKMRGFHGGKIAKSATHTLLLLAIVAASAWAFVLSESRGPAIGLAVGLMALVFFSTRGRLRILPVVMVLIALVWVGSYFASAANEPSSQGRSATIRFRAYVWGYAWDMFKDRPLTGNGQGGFVLAGDTYTVNDVINDPLVFESRVAHAHNEWIEVMTDLGCVGIALVLGALGLTVYAGMSAIRELPLGGERWALIGLLSALVGLVVAESFGVGMRVSGTPTMFFTVVGLIWALASNRPRGLVEYVSAKSSRRLAGGAVGIATALAALAVVQNDFSAARSAYGAGEALRSEAYGEAVRLGGLSRGSLSPQRRLENLARLAASHAMVASQLQQRALEREARAKASELPNPQLLALAKQDRERSDSHCAEGSQVLKELVSRSPGYFRQGQIEFELYLIQADNAAARNDGEEQDRCVKNAAMAIERELARRPYAPSVAVDYLSVVGDDADTTRKINLIARPLRHHRVTAEYVDFLAQMTDQPALEQELRQVTARALGWARDPSSAHEKSGLSEGWIPERLRLAAAMQIRRGNFEAGRQALEASAREYAAVAASAPIGAASCYAELADARFYAEPESPMLALAVAHLALTTTPESLTGRSLRRRVKHSMIGYYLAADDEQNARRLLVEFAPPGATDQIIERELGYRYRALCESLLRRREALLARPNAVELLSKLDVWSARAIELDPGDPLTHLLAAELAHNSYQCQSAAAHLSNAMRNGLTMETVRVFLQAALHKQPDCEPLQEIWNSVEDDLQAAAR